MRIKHNSNNMILFKRGVVSMVVVVIVCIIAASVNSNLRAIDDEDASRYTFTQTTRVFNGENWNDVEKNEDGEYYYYPAGSPDIVEFTFTVVANEETSTTDTITIKNSLPEGMEYIDDSLSVGFGGGYDGIPFRAIPPLTSESRELNLKAIDFSDGGAAYFPGYTGTVTFQARILFSKSDSCKSVSNKITFSAKTDDYSQTSTVNMVFESPCTGLPPPDPDPTPDPKPNPTPLPDPRPEDKPHINAPKTGAFRRNKTPLFMQEGFAREI